MLAAVLVTGCGQRGLTRPQLYDGYVKGLVDSGVPRDVAECVIHRLFDPLSDAKLKQFNTKGDRLSDAEMQRVRELAASCSGSTTTG